MALGEYLGSNSFASLQLEFGETEEFTFFRSALGRISPAIGAQIIVGPNFAASATKDVEKLSVRKDILCEFYKDLLPDVKSYARNSVAARQLTICLTFGSLSWQQKFQEHWFYRCFFWP